MKRITLLILILLLTIPLYGCKDKSELNRFDYSHKDPIPYEMFVNDSDFTDEIEEIINKINKEVE